MLTPTTRPRQIKSRRTFAIVSSQFNHEFVRGLVEFARRELTAHAPNVRVVAEEVFGAYEIPVIAQELAMQKNVDAVLAFGVIWRGQTAHADLIATSVTNALQTIALKHRVPIINQVLLVQDEEQARSRCLEDGPLNRGIEAAHAAIRAADVIGRYKPSAI